MLWLYSLVGLWGLNSILVGLGLGWWNLVAWLFGFAVGYFRGWFVLAFL